MEYSDDILIVDDNADFRAFVSSVFERVGYATRHAETGEGALSAVREERPFCVLLDVHLPGLTGYQVCRKLREEYGEGLPIIFITGVRTDPADRVAGLLLGTPAFVAMRPYQSMRRGDVKAARIVKKISAPPTHSGERAQALRVFARPEIPFRA